jgi:hypothetical protein
LKVGGLFDQIKPGRLFIFIQALKEVLPDRKSNHNVQLRCGDRLPIIFPDPDRRLPMRWLKKEAPG